MVSTIAIEDVIDAPRALEAPLRERVAEGLETKVGGVKLIGLNGRARSGKDTVGGFLQEAHTVATLSFAQPIRAALRSIFDWDDRHFHGELKEVVIPWLGKSPRQAMQLLGTEWGRQLINPDIWLTLAKMQIEQWLQKGINVVVTDVRFDNEAEMIRSLGGSIWHIYRPGPEIDSSAHASEAGLSSMSTSDWFIENKGTLQELKTAALYTFERTRNV